MTNYTIVNIDNLAFTIDHTLLNVAPNSNFTNNSFQGSLTPDPNTWLYKFPNETTAQTVLADYYDVEHGWKTYGIGYCLDPIGSFFNVVSFEDPENPVIAFLEGWHLNLKIWDNRPDPASNYRIYPTHQRRVFL